MNHGRPKDCEYRHQLVCLCRACKVEIAIEVIRSEPEAIFELYLEERARERSLQ